MHGLPQGFDASRFDGRCLEAVSFAVNLIHFDFGPGHFITVIKHVRYQLDHGEDLREDVVPARCSELPSLVGRVVLRAEVRRPGDLVLHFEDGGQLIVEDDSEHFESYSLGTSDGEVFV
jgi:hypothetical protein